MKRRTFLKRSALASCAGLMPAPALLPRPATHHPYAEPDLLLLLEDDEAVAMIGTAYLDAHPEKKDAGVLLRCIQQRIDTHALTPTAGAHKHGISHGISRSIKRDFTIGETHRLNGWILAETEAMQCALFSLLRA